MIMTPALDYKAVQATQRHQTLTLLDQLSHISAALKDLRDHKCLLRAQKYALFAQQHALFEQQQAMGVEEDLLLQEELAILAQLSSLRAR